MSPLRTHQPQIRRIFRTPFPIYPARAPFIGAAFAGKDDPMAQQAKSAPQPKPHPQSAGGTTPKPAPVFTDYASI